MLLLLLLPGRWLRFEKKKDYCLENLVPERKIRLERPIETKEWWNRPEGRYLLVLGIFPLNWSQQGRRAVMKNSGLQCLGGQIIQTAHGRQVEECLSEYTECIHKRALRSYLYQQRDCPRFSGGRRQVLYLMKSKGNDAKSRIMGGFEYLLYK